MLRLNNGETNTRGLPRQRRGFTLLELLVVISIIAILAGMVMPIFFSAKERAREAKAKVAVKALETAFKSYLDTYKVWPSVFVGGGEIKGDIFKVLRGDISAANKDGIPFFEFENYTNSAVMDPTTAYDPWANPDPSISSSERAKHVYRVKFDEDYNNIISVGGQDVYRSVVVWSPGGKQFDVEESGGGDDVASWR